LRLQQHRDALKQEAEVADLARRGTRGQRVLPGALVVGGPLRRSAIEVAGACPAFSVFDDAASSIFLTSGADAAVGTSVTSASAARQRTNARCRRIIGGILRTFARASWDAAST
jgi:hypothetical protein